MAGVQIRASTECDGERVLDIWCAAVDNTHDFLSTQDRRDIELMLRDFLPSAPLILAVDKTDKAMAFMLLDGGHLEALFVHPDFRGQGLGKTLVELALRQYPSLTTDVNKQNSQAVGFYERLGFECNGESPTDGDGRPYPLLHLSFRGA
ncbi:putative acetyltransferase [Roseibium hamelinense]|uniref:Putative acetyltransferase n=1 Tax=Roseibium hamelinense TaxID=150831 RepID=A0A562SNW5_9HYPH|nr:acetyltransferase [Roseibium hamelinense]MTI44325.1 acetyltransferase [Roseibium hamelinense]TWI82898.1 putative acetyltransferase [Roseibium hamelinense]